MEFIKSKKDLRRFIDYEKQLYHAKRASLFGPVLSERSIVWRYVSLLRYQEYFTNTKKKGLALFFKYKRVSLGRKYGFNIPINTIDMGFLMYHVGSVLINAEKIGKNFNCNINVALIAGGHDGSIPTLGDNVVLGYGSVICGGVNIPDGSAIGACSFVNKSFFETGTCIAGVPAKKISNNGSKTWGGCQIFASIRTK
jgi:serine O-acetyltransferase